MVEARCLLRRDGRTRQTREAGANAICTACPVCQFNLDTRQFEISTAERRRVEIPVFFLGELAAGAMELDVIDAAFRRHMTSVYRLVYEFWDEEGELRPPYADAQGEAAPTTVEEDR